jgi:polysaccharide deacetylase family protein (PEP-CTERM system associated)
MKPDSDRQATAPARAIVNAMSVDVEEYFQVSAFEGRVGRTDWDTWPSRVEHNTGLLLDLFARCGVSATFFCLGWVAERHPALIRRIVDEGHELASHGWDHTRVHDMDRERLRQDVMRTKATLEDIGGVQVLGYRAPTFSIGKRNLWALGVLREAGYVYSSSIFPVRHDLYGFPEAPRSAFTDADSGLLEVPMSTLRLFDRNLPFCGGGYFRLYPYPVTRWAVRRVNEVEQRPCIFYMHPWEVDPQQPRPERLSMRTRFRHYLNLDKVAGRLERMLGDFRWDRMDRIFLPEGAAQQAASAPQRATGT